jgi:hypothetical protein
MQLKLPTELLSALNLLLRVYVSIKSILPVMDGRLLGRKLLLTRYSFISNAEFMADTLLCIFCQVNVDVFFINRSVDQETYPFGLVFKAVSPLFGHNTEHLQNYYIEYSRGTIK